jgi:hypothetical protein
MHNGFRDADRKADLITCPPQNMFYLIPLRHSIEGVGKFKKIETALGVVGEKVVVVYVRGGKTSFPILVIITACADIKRGVV